MHMDAAAAIGNCPGFFQFADNLLDRNDIFIPADRTDHLCLICIICHHLTLPYFPLWGNTAITHKFPLTPLTVNRGIGIIMSPKITD